jgi:hypothetical protein
MNKLVKKAPALDSREIDIRAWDEEINRRNFALVNQGWD